MKKLLSLLLVLIASMTLIACDDTEEVEAKTYNIVLTNATIPPLMAVLDTLNNGHETFMWYGRNRTFHDISVLKDNITLVGDPENQEQIPGIAPQVTTEMKNKVSELYYDSNKKAKFNFYVVDYGIRAALQIFVETGINEENYKVFLLEDGTGSYVQFNDKDEYSKEGGKAKYDTSLENLNNILEEVALGTYKWNQLGDMKNWDLTFAYASKANVEYWLQYPELLSSSDQEMQDFLDNKGINFVKKRLTDMFVKLDEDNQRLFQKATLNTEILDPMLNIDNEKEILLVTGTSYPGEDLGFLETEGPKGEFEAVMDQIVTNYGNDYNILFKPHPAWMPALGDDMGPKWSELGLGWQNVLEERINYFKDNNISVLPGQTAIEPILWAYPDVKIGGYNSSLYMNALPEQVLFFILKEDNFDLLANPLPNIIDNGGLTNPTTNKKPSIIFPDTITD